MNSRIHFSPMSYCVCQTCGYFEMCVRDLSVLEKPDENGKWIPMEFVKEDGGRKLTMPEICQQQFSNKTKQQKLFK